MAKNVLKRAAKLTFLTADTQLVLTTDASDVEAGAVLEQVEKTGRRPLGFFSKVFSKPERNYSAFDRELSAIFKAIQHFQFPLVGRKVKVVTDHKPLVAALNKQTDAVSGHQQRQLSFISQYITEIDHIDGESNSLADLLSQPRPLCESEQVIEDELACAIDSGPISLGLDWAEVQREQESDREVQAMRNNPTLTVRRMKMADGVAIWVDASIYPVRVLMPRKFPRQVYKALHNLSHPGANSSVKLITQCAVWPNCKSQVRRWAKECVRCQRAKVGRHTKPPLHNFEAPAQRFIHLHVDFVRPLRPDRGKRYVMTIIDRYTRYPAAVTTSGVSAVDATSALWRDGFNTLASLSISPRTVDQHL